MWLGLLKNPLTKMIANKAISHFKHKEEKVKNNSESDVPKFEKVTGKSNNAEAKIAGITPAVLIFRGKCDDSPP